MSAIIIRAAQADDIDTIQAFIRALADYERLAHEVKADRETLGRYLFGPRPMAEVLIAEADGSAVGFALFFHNFSKDDPACIWRTCSYCRRHAGWARAKRSCPALQRSRWNATARGWNGRCSTGMNRPSLSIEP